MVKKKFASKKKKIFIIFSSVVLLGIFLQMSIKLIHGKSPLTPLNNIVILPPNPYDSASTKYNSKDNLQLRTFSYYTLPTQPPLNPVTPPPQNSPYCPPDVLGPQGVACQCKVTSDYAVACPKTGPTCPLDSIGEKEDDNILDNILPELSQQNNGQDYCWNYDDYKPGQQYPSNCVSECIEKPVVYLYPTETTDVSVSVISPGSIIVSDPHYPDNGWKHILAHPDGTLSYNNKKYSELFYETSVTQQISMPEKGIVMTYTDIQPVLQKTITQFGLNTHEQKEFLDYWVPRLQSLHSPYIFFSILDPQTKNSYDKLAINPEPVTRIELIAYFKPLQSPISVAQLSLPNQPPARVGFTEVEWGGMIAH